MLDKQVQFGTRKQNGLDIEGMYSGLEIKKSNKHFIPGNIPYAALSFLIFMMITKQ